MQPEVVGVDLAGAGSEVDGILEPLGGEVTKWMRPPRSPTQVPASRSPSLSRSHCWAAFCVRNVFVTIRPFGPRTRAS